jgi:hypothetical protein
MKSLMSQSTPGQLLDIFGNQKLDELDHQQ